MNHKIARLVVHGAKKDKAVSRDTFTRFIEKFVEEEFNKRHYEFVLTYGGFLMFEFPADLCDNLKLEEIERKRISSLQDIASNEVDSFFKSLLPEVYQKLRTIADFFFVGIDGYNSGNDNQRVELIAVYDLKNETIIRWTGKFYPTEGQKRTLIKVNDLNSHFIELNNQKVLILGCHDLNVYHPRGQAVATPDGFRRLLADKFKRKCKKFSPEVVLQHPHKTDSPRIWLQSWKALESHLPSVAHYASGVYFANYMNDTSENIPRATITDVLEMTKKGDVVDFYFYRGRLKLM